MSTQQRDYESKYLSLRDTHLELKRRNNDQEQTIKRCGLGQPMCADTLDGDALLADCTQSWP